MVIGSELQDSVNSGLVLRGNKVILRPFQVSDIDDTYVSWLNDPDVVRFSSQRFLRHDRQSCLRYLGSFENTENLFMSARRLSDNYQVGTLTAYVSSERGTADVGIMMGDKSVWGQGYGQDGWNTLTNWLLGQENIYKLTAVTLACNIGMIKLMERSGMIFESVDKGQEILEGLPVDVLHYVRFHAA